MTLEGQLAAFNIGLELLKLGIIMRLRKTERNSKERGILAVP